ncbi:MAG: hypothetical protein FVQ79_12890 [Planctomycetes bacterium]|nr:hypothetical protein [Planctomycetota bacterium]
MEEILKKISLPVFVSTGTAVIIIAGSYAVTQITGLTILPQSLPWTYISLLSVPIGMLFFLVGTQKYRLQKRRIVDQAEVESLYSEVLRLQENAPKGALETAEKEVERLKSRNGNIVELDVLPLRLSLVDLYSEEKELIAKAEYELKLLREYASSDYPELLDEWEKKIEESTKKITEKSSDDDHNNRNDAIIKLRADLKVLRETVAWYDKTWARGESILRSVSYWSAISVISMLLVGLLPLIHSEGNKILGILHWGALGFTGALLAVVVSIRDMDEPEVGEQEGKQVLLKTVGGPTIGMIAAVSLYGALSGGILSGTVFPDVPIIEVDSTFWENTGKSIFWGIFSGFSLRLFLALSRLAESTFGKDESE